jgi:large subunit ribosomal protein L4
MAKQTKSLGKTEVINGAVNIVTLGDLGLPARDKKVSREGFSTWVRALLQNWRQGTVACQGRSDVSFSNKKPWKQKGTGRARAGSARSPLWRGGGVIFGPQPRTRTLKVSHKLKKDVLIALLQDYCDSGRLVQLNWAVQESMPKTSTAFNALKAINLHETPVTLFVPFDDVVTYASFSNIPTVRMVFLDQANAFDLACGRYWLVLEKDMEQFKVMVNTWI